MFQKFILKKMLGSKLKAAGMSDDQIDMIIEKIGKNPEFFKKLKNEMDMKKKQGVSEQAAMMTIMREHQAEIQKIMMEK